MLRVVVAFLPCESWGPSGYTCAGPFLYLPLGKSHTFLAQAAFGEGARIANRLDFVTFRSEKFTLDEHGYRNLPTRGLTQPKVLLVGSSFSMGLSLNDEETLSAQINQRLGPLVYNGSTTINPYLSSDGIKQLSSSLDMNHGWVLLQLLNRAPYEYRSSSLRFGFLGPYRTRVRNASNRLLSPLEVMTRSVSIPFALIRLSSLLNMRLQNDVLLPNPYKKLYPEEELITGRRMLFYSVDREFSQHYASAAGTANAVAQLRDDLESSGLKLATVLVPTGYSVYYPFIRQTGGTDFGQQYMNELASRLAGKGIPTFNCLPLLREAAARELAAGRLVYWPDDAHWNAAGSATAARGVAPWLRDLISKETTLER